MRIRRGTPVSRALALLVAFSPLLLAVGLFVGWATGKWIDGGAELAKVEQRRHEAEAKTTQARLYAPLGEAWASYAETAVSGLSLEETADDAEQAVRARVQRLFTEAKGALTAVERLPDVQTARPGLQQMQFEFSGVAPEQATPALLSALETETPYLFVEFLDLERDPQAARRLRVRARLSLYRLSEGEGGA